MLKWNHRPPNVENRGEAQRLQKRRVSHVLNGVPLFGFLVLVRWADLDRFRY